VAKQAKVVAGDSCFNFRKAYIDTGCRWLVMHKRGRNEVGRFLRQYSEIVVGGSGQIRFDRYRRAVFLVVAVQSRMRHA
jgi:hypothetical protein